MAVALGLDTNGTKTANGLFIIILTILYNLIFDSNLRICCIRSHRLFCSMKHKNKMTSNGSPAPADPGRDEANKEKPGVPVDCVFPEKARQPVPVPVKLPKGRAFRAEMHRRFTAPFAFNARQHCGPTNESPPAARPFKRMMILVVGGTVLIAGLAMVVLPGPAFIVVPAGLAILAVEFAWARRWLRSARALLPRRSPGSASTQKRMTLKSVGRGMEFLFRQVRRTLLPKRKSSDAGGVKTLPLFAG
jgi:uncharacterized protein (TIGR02611 family)